MNLILTPTLIHTGIGGMWILCWPNPIHFIHELDTFYHPSVQANSSETLRLPIGLPNLRPRFVITFKYQVRPNAMLKVLELSPI